MAATVPVFCTVTVCAALVEPTFVEANVRLVGLAVNVAVPAAVPVPVNATVNGLLVALPVTDTEPVRVPAAVGVNFTVTVHDAPAAIDEPQVFVCEKSPVAATPETVAAAVPVLVTVTACVALVVPTVWLPNVSDDGLAVSVAEPPPPDVANCR